MTNVTVPSVGESVTSGIISAWLKNNGDVISEGEEIFELETDKATLPIPAPASGMLSILSEEGSEVHIGDTVAKIDEQAAGTPPQAQKQEEAAPPAHTESQEKKPSLSPAARRHAEEQQVDVAKIKGTGKGTRITKKDVLNAAANTPASPAPPTTSKEASQTRSPMSTLRKRISENLVRSKQISAHLTTFNEVDMTKTMALRAQYKDEFLEAHAIRLGFMSFFIKASAHALQSFPAVNAYVDGTDIIYNHAYHIGVAMSTEAGLIVPVLRDAERKGFAEIESTISDFATRAKNKRIMPDEFSGGTFTITNGGVFGSMLSTPIPSPPQTAILGMHSIQKRAVVKDDQILIRPMMYLALTYDHRIIDGREAIQFLLHIKHHIEEPERLLLNL